MYGWLCTAVRAMCAYDVAVGLCLYADMCGACVRLCDLVCDVHVRLSDRTRDVYVHMSDRMCDAYMRLSDMMHNTYRCENDAYMSLSYMLCRMCV